MSFDLAQILGLVIGAILPLITGLITKSTATPGVKAVVLLALSGVTGFLTNLSDALATHTAFNAGTVFVAVLFTFITGVGAYFGFLKPTQVASKVAAYGVGRRAAVK